jgi:hypothetical protein
VVELAPVAQRHRTRLVDLVETQSPSPDVDPRRAGNSAFAGAPLRQRGLSGDAPMGTGGVVVLDEAVDGQRTQFPSLAPVVKQPSKGVVDRMAIGRESH